MTFSLLSLIEVLGTFSFAVSGAFAAMEKKLDPFGVMIIAFATSVGGGTVRDLIIGRTPVAWLVDNTTIWVILFATAAALFFSTYLKKLDRLLFLFDAIGLGLFTLIGLQKSRETGLDAPVCVMLGTITGCFGGVLRDVLLNTVPLIFRREIYASASVLGGTAFYGLLSAGVAPEWAFVTSLVLVTVIRLLAVYFNWSLPPFYHRTPSSAKEDD